MIYETFDASKHDTRKVAKLIYDVDFRTFDLLFKNSDKAISTIEKQLKKEESLEDTKVILDDDNNIHEIICTEDHKIYADNKYIQAKDLQLSQNVIIYPQKHLK